MKKLKRKYLASDRVIKYARKKVIKSILKDTPKIKDMIVKGIISTEQTKHTPHSLTEVMRFQEGLR